MYVIFTKNHSREESYPPQDFRLENPGEGRTENPGGGRTENPGGVGPKILKEFSKEFSHIPFLRQNITPLIKF